MSTQTDVEEAIAHLVDKIRRNYSGDPTDRRDIAVAVLHLRTRCRDSNGYPDLGGRSDRYRRAIKEAYTRAGLPPGQEERVKKSVRHYMPPLIRQAFDSSDYELPDDPHGYYLVKPDSATSATSSRARTAADRTRPPQDRCVRGRIERIHADLSGLLADEDAREEIAQMPVTGAVQVWQMLEGIGKTARALAETIE